MEKGTGDRPQDKMRYTKPATNTAKAPQGMMTKNSARSPVIEAPPQAIRIRTTMARRERTVFITCYLFRAVIILCLARENNRFAEKIVESDNLHVQFVRLD